MSKGTITFNGVNFENFGCYYDGAEVWRKPQKVVDFYSVPGRSGDLTISQQKWANVDIPFNCYIKDNFTQNFNGLYNALASVSGYAKLTYTEDPGHFRRAQFVAEVQPITGQGNREAQFELVFNCMPQRFIDPQKIPITWEYDYTTESYNGIVVANPTAYDASPVYYFKLSTVHSIFNFEIWTPYGETARSYTAMQFVDVPDEIKDQDGIKVDTANETVTDQITGEDLTSYLSPYHPINWDVLRFTPGETKEIVLGESQMGADTYMETGFYEL